MFGAMLSAQNLTKEQVSIENIRLLLAGHYDKNEIIDDGSLRITDSKGMVLFIKVDEKRGLIWIQSAWGSNGKVSESTAYEIVNEWNLYHVPIATTAYGRDLFWFQYCMSFEGGINAENLNDTIDWGFSQFLNFGEFLDSKGALL